MKGIYRIPAKDIEPQELCLLVDEEADKPRVEISDEEDHCICIITLTKNCIVRDVRMLVKRSVTNVGFEAVDGTIWTYIGRAPVPKNNTVLSGIVAYNSVLHQFVFSTKKGNYTLTAREPS